MSLGHLGIDKAIALLETEKSKEAAAVNRFWNTCRDAVLRDGQWPFATKFATLSQVALNPTIEWGYSYQYPSDCLGFRKILSGERNDSRATRVPFRIVNNGTNASKLIYTDAVQAQAEYTMLVDNYDLWAPDFILCFSYRLAAYIAPTLRISEASKVQATLMQLYRMELSIAYANAFNEQQDDVVPEAEWIDGR